MNTFSPIAVTGMSTLFPQAVSLDEFWRLILSGRDCFSEVPPSYWLIEDFYDSDPKAPLKTYSRRGAFLDKIPFNPMEFGIPPNLLPSTDIVQVLALILARDVLSDTSGGQIARLNLERTSVILGVSSGTDLLTSMSGLVSRPLWIEGMRQAGIPEPLVEEATRRISALFPQWDEASFPGLLGNVVAGRITNRFDMGGTNCVIDAACASSLAALHVAASELQLGRCDRVITGGLDALNNIFSYMCFSKTPALSPTGQSKPFSREADGMMLGEGGGMLVLRKLEDAERDGDKVYAVIRGIGSSSDGRSKSVYAPRSAGQQRALENCYSLAGYNPETVGLVEGHGTGTTAGDESEIDSLEAVFLSGNPSRRKWCALGSIKSQIGHTKGAAGAAGLVKAVLAVNQRCLPPTANVTQPHRRLEAVTSPFYVNTQARPWIEPFGTPRRASVSSFGFGGTNFHVTLEEFLGSNRACRVPSRRAEIFLVSGLNSEDLRTALTRLIEEFDSLSFQEIARGSQESYRIEHPWRVAILAPSFEILAQTARQILTRLNSNEREMAQNWWIARGEPALDSSSLAFLFPGQGSQSVGMMADLALHFPEAMDSWGESEAAARLTGLRLAELVYPAPSDSAEKSEAQEVDLRRTEHSQPALGAVSLACLAVLSAAQIHPAMAAGHSYGELVALRAAGVFTHHDLIKISRKRGELMAAAVGDLSGAMTAVSLSPQATHDLLHEAKSDCVVANENSPTQCVVAGPSTSIQKFEEFLIERKVTFQRLAVATAFHSPMVAVCSQEFGEFLKGVSINRAQFPVYSNTTAEIYGSDVRGTLAAQIAHPVRFSTCLQKMRENGARIFLEVGPGSVLTGLARHTLGNEAHCISMSKKGKPADESVLAALAQLAVLGIPVNWSWLWDAFRAPQSKMKTTAATLQVGGNNFGRHYPPANGAAGKTPPVQTAETSFSNNQMHGLATNMEQKSPPVEPLRANISERTEPSAAQVPPPAISPSRQASLARVHEHFLQTISEAHQAFLAAATGKSIAAIVPAPSPSTALQANKSAEVVHEMAGPQTWPLAAPNTKTEQLSAEPAHQTISQRRQPELPQVAAPQKTPSVYRNTDLKDLVLSTIAEKTGYPRDMLNPAMKLEADLGIDSIKRVEILSAVQSQLPEMPPIDAKAMGSLQTLDDISNHLAYILNTSEASTGNATVQPTPATVNKTIGIEELVLATVAAKTGYPIEMLNPAMKLEADLGIDSIKRVEILSAVQQQLPEMPPMDAKVMGGLQTLGDVSHFIALQIGNPAESENPVKNTPPTATQNITLDIQSIVLDTVAEKTGYPREMLTPSMKLEADLGIDSIKRVEILSAVHQRSPQIPVLDAKAMAGLQTLAEISDFLHTSIGGVGQKSQINTVDESYHPKNNAIAENSAHEILRRLVVQSAPIAIPYLIPSALRSARKVIIANDVNGFASALQSALMRFGITSEVSNRVPLDCDALIVLAGLEICTTPEKASDAYIAVLNNLQAIATRFAEHGGYLALVQNTGGSFGLDNSSATNVWQAGYSGIAKTAAKEWPKAVVRTIDLEVNENALNEGVAARLAGELCQGGDEGELGLRADGSRIRPELLTAELKQVSFEENSGAVVLATGGARGVTALCLIELARRQKSRIVLLGRTKRQDEPAGLELLVKTEDLRAELLRRKRAAGQSITPVELAGAARDIITEREIRTTIAQIEKVGGKALYFSVDAQDSAAIANIVKSVRADWGPITTIVHGAGVLADSFIKDKTPEQFRRVFHTKVKGLQSLILATQAEPISEICLFSSVAGRFGNVGQSDYAAANEVLNMVAAAEAARRGSSCRVRSINWGPWDGGMVSTELRHYFQSQGVALLSPLSGANAFVSEMMGNPVANNVQVVITAGNGELSAKQLDQQLHRYDFTFDFEHYPFLRDHQVKNHAVLMVALVTEWMLRATLGLRPLAKHRVLKDLQVLKGFILPFENGSITPTHLTMEVREISDTELTMTLLDADGKGRYSATASFVETVLPEWVKGLRSEHNYKPFSTSAARIYDRHLFHGPSLQVISALNGYSESGAEVIISGSHARVKENETVRSACVIDPVLLDGALQLTGLWALEVFGKPVLPMGCKTVTHLRRPEPDEPLTCILRGTEQAGMGIVADICCQDSQGRPVILIEGGRCYYIDSYWE